MTGHISRRQVLGGLAALAGAAAVPVRPLDAASPHITPTRRIAVLDWAMAETLTGLGVVPVAMAEPDRYRARAQDDRLPAGVIDLGLTTQPDLERLSLVAPDLIVTGHGQDGQIGAALARIAPLWAGSIYTGDGAPLAAAMAVARGLGARLNRADAAEALIRRCLSRIDAAAARLTPAATAQPVAVFVFQDQRHGWVADANGFIHAVMTRMGITNAWPLSTAPGRPSFWGYTAIGIDRLATLPDCRLIHADFPLGPGGWRPGPSTIWQALPAVAQSASASIGPFWYFGALPTMARFADQLADALAGIDAGRKG